MNTKCQTMFGIIQLSLLTSDNHLTLKIIQVKRIHSNLENILVKITFIPDRKPLECFTRTVSNINGSGIFNEKFTFEINDDDLNKRLCFSVYDYNQDTSDMNLHGCLSFGIRNTIKKQKIHGWFYLLKEDIGELRHKKVINYDEIQVTKINRDIVNLEEYQFTISRDRTGSFGFTVVGDSPTFIGKVNENSPSSVCGLKSGDYIVRVNGQNVSRAQQRTVSNLIKHSKNSVVLDVHRYPSIQSNRDIASSVSSFGTLSTEDSLTYSDSSQTCQGKNRYLPFRMNRQFINLAQLGYYVEPKPLVNSKNMNSPKPFYELTSSSMLAVKGSPTNTFV